jgi:hypothetical protein
MIYLIRSEEQALDRLLEDQAKRLVERPKRGPIVDSSQALTGASHANKIYVVACFHDLKILGGFSPNALAAHVVSKLNPGNLQYLQQVTLHAGYAAFAADADSLPKLLESFAGRFYIALAQQARADIKVKANIGAVFCLPGGALRVRRKHITRLEFDRALTSVTDISEPSHPKEDWEGFAHQYLYEKGEGRVYFKDGGVVPVAEHGKPESYSTTGWVVDTRDNH